MTRAEHTLAPIAADIDETLAMVRAAAASLPPMCAVVGEALGMSVSAVLRPVASAAPDDEPDWSISVDRGPNRCLGIRASGTYGELCDAWARGPESLRLWVTHNVIVAPDGSHGFGSRPDGRFEHDYDYSRHREWGRRPDEPAPRRVSWDSGSPVPDPGWDPDEPMPADAFDGLTTDDLGLPPEGCVVLVDGIPVSFPDE